MFEGIPRDRIATPIEQATPYLRKVHAETCARLRRMAEKGRPDTEAMSPWQWKRHLSKDREIRRLAEEERQARADLAAQSILIEETKPQAPRWGHSVEEMPPARPPIRKIQTIVARFYGIDLIEIFSQRRHASIVFPRQVAMYLSNRLTTRSLPEIGRCFGGRDHTTIIHGVRKIKARRETDPDLAAQLAELERLLSPDGGA